MKIYLDVRNVCQVETENGDIYELYDNGEQFDVSLFSKDENTGWRKKRDNMKVGYIQLGDTIPIGEFSTVRFERA